MGQNAQNTKKVGDPIYICRSGSWDTHYTKGTIVKVTPAGMVDVQVGTLEPMRFRPDGKLQGKKGFRAEYLDTISFAEREAIMAKNNRARAAENAISDIKVQGNVNFHWGAVSMTEELNRLEALITAARAKVEAIG